MSAPMIYLYGDSTPSTLQSNFLQFLEDALDMAVHLLLSGDRMRQCSERVSALKADADSDVLSLKALSASIARLLSEAPDAKATPRAAACAAAIAEQAAETVRKRLAEVEAELTTKVAAVEAEAAVERAACLTALEALLRGGDPPSATTNLQLVQQAGKYVCKRATQTPYGLAWTFEIEIAPPHAYSEIVRVSRFLPQLEVTAPEMAGWLRKEVRNRAHRLEKLLVTEMTWGPEGALVRLRSSLDDGATGFDVAFAADGAGVRLTRVGDAGDSIEPTDEDRAKLLAFHEKLREAALAIDRGAARLADATLDERSIGELLDPGIVVDRIVSAMAPIVAEIAQHSLSKTELVLKKDLGDHRREEIFLSKASLKEKLAALPEPLRAYFAPLALMGPGVRQASTPPPARSESRPEVAE